MALNVHRNHKAYQGRGEGGGKGVWMWGKSGGGGGCTQVMGTKGDGIRKYRQEREVSKHGA